MKRVGVVILYIYFSPQLLAVSVEVSPMDIKSAEDDKISPEFSFVRTGAGTD